MPRTAAAVSITPDTASSWLRCSAGSADAAVSGRPSSTSWPLLLATTMTAASTTAMAMTIAVEYLRTLLLAVGAVTAGASIASPEPVEPRLGRTLPGGPPAVPGEAWAGLSPGS